MTSSLRVVTYNMHKGFSGLRRRFVLHRIREALGDSQAHVVLLQEVQGHHRRRAKYIEDWPEAAQYEFIATGLWPNFVYGKNAIHAQGHHGNAILSCFPMVGQANVRVSPYPFPASRGLLHSIIELAGREVDLHVFCVHFGFIGFERRHQVARLFAYIAQEVPADAPLLIAGDFNDWSGNAIEESEIGAREAHKQLHGAYAQTWPSWAPSLPMDRIYFRGIEVASAERLNGYPWTKLSDHLPLQATFSL